jgi:3-hydroxyisobutyrate dehydrogenase-like beta-hydroxyacid dehydrogenase
MSAASTKVAILGMGRMGSSIARRLADYEPAIWNRTRAKAEQLGMGAVASAPAEAVSQADVVITCLTGADAVRAAYEGPDGALAAAHGQVFVEMSTAGPDVLEELDPKVRATGSALIDAPIVGAPTAILRGAGAILVGGAPADLERVRPVLAQLGDVRPVGPLGSGARLKLISNSMLATITVAAAELQVGGEAVGLDPEFVFWVLARHAPALEMRRAGYLQRRHQPTLFAVRDLHKDLDLALELLQRAEAPAPVVRVVHTVVGEVMEQAADLDITAVITHYDPGSSSDETSH